jgi:hypothetical protein
MSRLRRSSIVLLVAFGLIAGAGIASAAEGDPAEEPPEETLLNFGYDEDNHIFLVNTSATDSTYDCTLENGTLTAQYGATDDGSIRVDMLLDEDQEAIQFANRPEVGSDITSVSDPALYAADGDCGISGGVVGGPNGQINHGQFMRLFHQLVDGRGMGCLNRVIAQSDLGKGDQQLQTSDVDVDATFAPATTGQVDFTTVAADCNRDKKDKGENHPASSNAQGKKDKGDKSDRPDSPGNSGNAPGKNK